MNTAVTRIIYGFVITGSIIFSFYHLMYWADSVAKYSNYFISLGILPAFVGISLGCIGAMLLEKSIIKGIKNNLKIKALALVATLAPVVYVLGIMQFSTH